MREFGRSLAQQSGDVRIIKSEDYENLETLLEALPRLATPEKLEVVKVPRIRRGVTLCLFALMAGAARAEQWFMVQSPVSVSVDTASIQILPSGQRRARVKHDMSLVAQDPKEPPNRPLFFITTMIFDCKKQSSRAESGEAHLADGTVTQWQRKNPQEIWLKTDDDLALAFVCGWPGPNGPSGVKRYPGD